MKLRWIESTPVAESVRFLTGVGVSVVVAEYLFCGASNSNHDHDAHDVAAYDRSAAVVAVGCYTAGLRQRELPAEVSEER